MMMITYFSIFNQKSNKNDKKCKKIPKKMNF